MYKKIIILDDYCQVHKIYKCNIIDGSINIKKPPFNMDKLTESQYKYK